MFYDLTTTPHNAEGSPVLAAAEIETVPREELHARVMFPLYAGYTRDIVPCRGAVVILTWDETGTLYETIEARPAV